jgi:hypothetical protein
MHIMLFLTFWSQRLPALLFFLFYASRDKLGDDILRAGGLLIQSLTIKAGIAVGSLPGRCKTMTPCVLTYHSLTPICNV